MTTTQGWRPAPFADPQLDLAMKVLFDTLYNALKVASGSILVTGSRNGIATGLPSVSNVVASIDNGTSACTEIVTARPSPATAGSIDIFVWQASGAASVTQRTVRWHATQ